ncbi:MAG: isoamylase early set domain-containing protein [Chloroflexi bacterium]|nr:isoamylase early set domain-containing protein [Chloroflexota bacterium]MBU1750437.1 isoamylase early set domain-containing protein [Chloroflexota bacterium]MBU1878998.1 isoamylase early set domain-containing protein [Chloroflexota bacterium]
MLAKTPLDNGLVRVTFHVSEWIWADHVALVGDFNDWDTHRHVLQQTLGDLDWHITLELEAGQSYHFRYLVNEEEWLNDDHADTYEPNPYGGFDSVVCT